MMKSMLFYSSFLFSLPGFYAYDQGLPYSYLYRLLLLTFLSANHWINPQDDWKKKIDIAYASYSFLYFFYKGIKHVDNAQSYLLGYSGATVCVGSYALSNYYYMKKKPYWVRYHLLFHVTSVGLQFLVIHHLLKSSSSSSTKMQLNDIVTVTKMVRDSVSNMS